MLDVMVLTEIADIGQDDWDRCFAGEAENWAFYHATEKAGIPAFDWFYIVVHEDGQPRALVPGFVTDYRLDTTVQGPLKRWTERLTRWLPGLMTLRLVSLGSPVAEICHIGFAPGLPDDQKNAAVTLVFQALERIAAARQAGLVAIKDADPQFGARIDRLARGYKMLPGLPTALLPLGVGSLEEYLSRLSRATRKDMKRKWKHAADLRIERRTDVSDVIDEIADLYAQTVSHSDLRFEYLPPGFFSRLLQEMDGQAYCFLYWAAERLVAFNLVIQGKDRLIDKYIGINYPDVPRYSPYFVSWLNNVDFCIRNGLPIYQAGQAFYGAKLRLGCRLMPTRQYFRHRNPAVNLVLRIVSWIVRLDRHDPHVGSAMPVPEGAER